MSSEVKKINSIVKNRYDAKEADLLHHADGLVSALICIQLFGDDEINKKRKLVTVIA